MIYRGALTGAESGTEEEPIRLTSDPAWGTGRAVISAAHLVSGKWVKTPAEQATAMKFPKEASGKLWEVAIPGDFTPRALWEKKATDGKRRLTLARWPNWKIDHEYETSGSGSAWRSTRKDFPG